MQAITVTELQKSPGKYIRQAEDGKMFFVTRRGKTILVLMSFDFYLQEQAQIIGVLLENTVLRAQFRTENSVRRSVRSGRAESLAEKTSRKGTKGERK